MKSIELNNKNIIGDNKNIKINREIIICKIFNLKNFMGYFHPDLSKILIASSL